jgi:NIMA (never in mitosis gene a)-related kinase 1/4/5
MSESSCKRMRVEVKYPLWYLRYEEWLDEIEQIYLMQTNEAFTELNYGHAAKYRKLKMPEHMIQYKNVRLVDFNGVTRLQKTYKIREKEIAVKEADFLRQLQHPNINAFIDIVRLRYENEILLFLEYCQYGELRNYLGQQKSAQQQISPEIILLWMKQLLSAIEYMHELNIVHCDIKPQNVFVMDERRLCIGDMDCAQIADADGVCKEEIGTPSHQAPENVCDEKPCSKKSDIWGVGCVFVEAMTLDIVFTPRHCSYRLVQNNVVHARMLKTQYPEIQRRVVNLCLQADPRKRPSAKDLLLTLA